MRERDFSLLQKCPDQLWGPPSLLFKGCKSSFLGVKRPGHEGNPSPPPHKKVKKGLPSWYRHRQLYLHSYYRLSLLTTTLPSMQVIGWVGYSSMINKPRGGGNQWLSAKILATYHGTFTPKIHILPSSSPSYQHPTPCVDSTYTQRHTHTQTHADRL